MNTNKKDLFCRFALCICAFLFWKTLAHCQVPENSWTLSQLVGYGYQEDAKVKIGNGHFLYSFRKNGSDQGTSYTDYTLYYYDGSYFKHIPDVVLPDGTKCNEVGLPYEDIKISEDTKWFAAEQKIASHERNGYLYHYNGNNYLPFSLNGKKFDSAAWSAIAHINHAQEQHIDETRMIRFDRWIKDRLCFTLIGHSTSGRSILWKGYYDVDKARFSL